MGGTYVEGTVFGPGGAKVVAFLVDSGATYTVLPTEIWNGIRLRATRSARFTLPDGTAIKRQVSEARIALAEGVAFSPVVMGEPGDEALLGIVTLENLGLVLNPFTRRLQPMRMVLA